MEPQILPELSISQYRKTFFVNDQFYNRYYKVLRPKYGFEIPNLAEYFSDLYGKVLMYRGNWRTDPYGLKDYNTAWLNTIFESNSKEEALKYALYMEISSELSDGDKIIHVEGCYIKFFRSFSNLHEHLDNILFTKQYFQDFPNELIQFLDGLNAKEYAIESDIENGTNRTIDRVAWIIHLGILDHLQSDLHYSPTDIGKVLSQVLGNDAKPETIRRCIGDYMSGGQSRNNPYNSDRIKKMNDFLINKGLRPIE